MLVKRSALEELSLTTPEALQRFLTQAFFIYNDYLRLVPFLFPTVVRCNLSICLCLVASKKNGT